MHIKKHKGDIGVTKVIADLTEKGFNVSIPLSEHLKYDLIVEKEAKIKRVQVRFTSSVKGAIPVKLKSSWSDKKGNHITKREKSDYDILAIFCPETMCVYYLKDEDFSNSSQVTIRLEKSKNNQQVGVRYASECLFLLI